MDPVTISVAVGVASKAFDAIKKGFAVGRDIEQMSGDIGRWMGAVSDVDNAEKPIMIFWLWKVRYEKNDNRQYTNNNS